MTMNIHPTPISSHAAFVAGGTMASSLQARALSSSSAEQGDNDEAGLQALLELPARHVSGLPAPMALRLRVPGAPVPVVVWTGEIAAQARAAVPVLADSVVFDGGELDAIVMAAEADRLWHVEFLGLCFEKWRRPDVPVREAELLAGANPDTAESWSFGRVLRRLGVALEAVAYDVQPSARPLHAAA